MFLENNRDAERDMHSRTIVSHKGFQQKLYVKVCVYIDRYEDSQRKSIPVESTYTILSKNDPRK